ncbi:unnamed protein product [Ectocarpus sp. 8 AP-2014]
MHHTNAKRSTGPCRSRRNKSGPALRHYRHEERRHAAPERTERRLSLSRSLCGSCVSKTKQNTPSPEARCGHSKSKHSHFTCQPSYAYHQLWHESTCVRVS